MEVHKGIKFLYMLHPTWFCSKVACIPHESKGFCIPPYSFEWMMQGHSPSQFLRKHHMVWCQPPILECQ
jgi:hypothetical protein